MSVARPAALTLLVLAAAALAACGGASPTKVGPRGTAETAKVNGAIAFERYAHPEAAAETGQIVVRARDGTVRQLTHVRGGAYAPAWSPDGTRIAFERSTGGERHVLYTMKADGRDARPLASGCTAAARCLFDVAPAYSPDGRRVSFERVYGPLRRRQTRYERFDVADAVDLMVVDAHGGAPRAVAHWGADPQPWDGAPRWAPDGRRLVLPLGTFAHHNKHTALGTALVVLDVDGGRQRRITSWDLGAGNPDWAPDGRRIVFNSEGGHSRSVYVVAPDGTGLARLVKGGSQQTHLGDAVGPAWSPDGRQIVLTSILDRCSSLHAHSRACARQPYSFDVFVMHADGTGLRAVTTARQDEHRPAWGPAPG